MTYLHMQVGLKIVTKSNDIIGIKRYNGMTVSWDLALDNTLFVPKSNGIVYINMFKQSV